MNDRASVILTTLVIVLAVGAPAVAQDLAGTASSKIRYDIPQRTSTALDRHERVVPPRVDKERPAPALVGGLNNDDCADAEAVDVPSTTPGTTTGAAPDPEAGPACGTEIDTGGVWYSVIGTGNTITATMCTNDPVLPGSADFRSRISVFCGACETLACVDGDDGSCGFFGRSTVSWCTEDGVEYLVLVHGDSEQGNFELSVYDDGAACADPPDCAPPATGACCFTDFTCSDLSETACAGSGGFPQGAGTFCFNFDCESLIPDNDMCVGATPVAVPSVTDGSTTFASLKQVGICGPFVDSPGVWYAVTGTGNTISVTTCNGDPVQPGDADFDTKINVYCGSCNTSDCCFGNFTPGCQDENCEFTVCQVDPFCCDTSWDGICADQATQLCGDLCQPTFCVTGNDDACPDGGFLQSTATWCSEVGRTYFVYVHGFDSTGDFSLSVYDDGEPCDFPPICDACDFECAPGHTLEDEPNCGIPEDIVNGGCNSPIGVTSSCCVPGSEPGCDDFLCANLVCSVDPFCCDEQWDQACAFMAVEMCDACTGIEYPMMPISCGETYCSTAGAGGSQRDVDWYKLELAEDSLVEVTANCGFPALFGIIDNGGVDSCVGLSDFVSFGVSQACETRTAAAYLTAGTWYLIIAPAQFDFLECQTDYEFTVTCSNPGACCYDDGMCRQRGEEDCAAEGGTYMGADSDCFVLDGAPVSYTSEPGAMIPDGNPNGLYDVVDVDQSMPVGKVTVDVNISHTWIADLQISLTHEPTQTSAVLWQAQCDGAQNLEATFDDDGEEVECWVPTTGVIAPLEVNGTLLSAFQGIDAAGEWTLHVTDAITPDAGLLVSWTLNIESGEPQCAQAGGCCPGCPYDCADGDGFVDMRDLKQLLAEWGTTGSCSADGGVVDFASILELLAAWGPCPTDCDVLTQPACESGGGTWTAGTDCSGTPCGD